MTPRARTGGTTQPNQNIAKFDIINITINYHFNHFYDHYQTNRN